MNQADKVAFDVMCTRYYLNKLQSCKDRNIAFNLTFTQVKNMLRAKRCQYTGLVLTKSKGAKQLATDVTIERIDPTKPYESGNVCAVSYAANMFKAQFDDMFRGDSGKVIAKMSKRISKHTK